MNKNAGIIAQACHYICEGIILFYFVLLIIQFSVVVQHPFLGYLLILFSSMAVLSILAYFEKSSIYYILIFIIMLLLFVNLGFPFSVSIIFSSFLVYRYWRINQTDLRRDEAIYLGIASLLAVILFLLNGSSEVIWLLLIQYFIVFFGYLFSNFSMVSTDERGGFGRSLWIIITGILLLSAAAFVFLTEIFEKMLGLAWQGVGMITVFFSTLFANLFQGIQPNIEVSDGVEATESMSEEVELGTSFIEGVATFVSSYIVIALIIICALFIFLFLRFRRSKRDKDEGHEQQKMSKSSMRIKNPSYRTGEKGWKKFFRKPDHPVRRLVYQFERDLSKTKYARKQYETIEKWLERIGRGAELHTYQQVRYGNKEVSNTEINLLKTELAELKNFIESEKDNRPV